MFNLDNSVLNTCYIAEIEPLIKISILTHLDCRTTFMNGNLGNIKLTTNKLCGAVLRQGNCYGSKTL